MKIRILMPFGGRTVGDIEDVSDIDGVPYDEYWRRRLRDSKQDGCCEIVKDKARPAKSKPSKSNTGGEK
jgi:hypothetical protein